MSRPHPRICKCCGETKPLQEFKPHSVLGRSLTCQDCYDARTHPRVCSKCGKRFPLEQFKRGNGPEGYTCTCQGCFRAARGIEPDPAPEPEPDTDAITRLLRANRDAVLSES